jgi:hypothetical protein
MDQWTVRFSSEIDDGKILGAKGRPDRLQHADGQA